MTTEKTSTPSAQPAAAPAPAAASTTTTLVAPVAAPAPAAPAAPADLTLDSIERANDKAQIAKMAERLAAIEAERAAEKQQAIVQLVDEKIATGHVPPEQRETAIWAFTQDRTRAEQIYAHRQVPIGQRQSTTVPGAPGAGANTSTPPSGPIDMSQFTHGELMTIDCLMGAHKTRDQAIAVVLTRRAKVN